MKSLFKAFSRVLPFTRQLLAQFDLLRYICFAKQQGEKVATLQLSYTEDQNCVRWK